MSEPENFLARWSRRKRDGADEINDAKAPAETPGDDRGLAAETDKSAAGDGPRAEPSEPPFDLESLPPIESITADTDIRPFLASGVPLELSRAALRRAWAADPKIRDFVGLADYDWDFNEPGAVPGFGPLEMTDELRQAVARIIGPTPGEHGPAATPAAASVDPGSTKNADETSPEEQALATTDEERIVGIAQAPPVEKSDEAQDCDEPRARGNADLPAQHGSNVRQNLRSITRRGHGRALPK